MVISNNYFIVTILCLHTIYNCTLSIVGQYIYQFFLRTYPNIPSENGTNISLFTSDNFELNEGQCRNSSSTSAQDWAQQRSADLIFRTTLWRAFPLIIITYLFGLYGPYLNRRIILLLSILGNAIHVIIYQAIIYKNLAEYWWYISAFVAGLSGGTNVLGIVINLIITESTEEHERSTRFIRLGGLTTALSAIVTFGIGYYIQWRGFTDLFWMAIVLEFLSILAVIFLLKPTTNSFSSIDETTSLLSTPLSNNENVEIEKSSISNCYHCFDICKIFSCQQHLRKKTIILFVIIISYIFHLLALSSMSPLLWYLLGTPFCWSSEDLGRFFAISCIITAIFSVIGMKVLTYFGANDAIICALGHICLFGYSLWIALSKYSWQLYLALLINPFSSYQSVLTVSMISKWLEVNERNNVFTLITEVNTITLAFGGSASNWIYARTVTHQKNFTLLFTSGLSIIALIFNLCLFMITRRIPIEQQSTRTSEVDAETIPFVLSETLLPQGVDVACSVLPSQLRSNSVCIPYHGSRRASPRRSIDFHYARANPRRSIDFHDAQQIII